jgi:hypothetical protein
MTVSTSLQAKDYNPRNFRHRRYCRDIPIEDWIFLLSLLLNVTLFIVREESIQLWTTLSEKNPRVQCKK